MTVGTILTGNAADASSCSALSIAGSTTAASCSRLATPAGNETSVALYVAASSMVKGAPGLVTNDGSAESVEVALSADVELDEEVLKEWSRIQRTVILFKIWLAIC